MSPNISETKAELLDTLPTDPELALSYPDLAEALHVSTSTVRDHITELERRSGIDLGTVNADRKRFYLEGGIEHPTNHNPSYQEETRNKQAKTQTATEHLTQLEARLHAALDGTPAPRASEVPQRDGHEDVVIHRTDSHFGDQLTDEFGNVVFDTEILLERERQVQQETARFIERQRQAGVEFDTAHYLLGGDHVTGENIYPQQQSEIKDTLDEQIQLAYDLYIEQIQWLSNEFPAVQVVCQPGNHGELEAGYSEGANMDRLLFMMLDEAVRMSDMENVTFIRNESTKFTNFYVRGDRESYERHGNGWKFHLRHGQDSLEHIGTSAGKRRWYNWMLRHNFDQAYRGHYHQFEIDSIHGDTTVLMTGSPKPPDDYEESIAEWSAPSATVHGVSDSDTMSWLRPIYFTK